MFRDEGQTDRRLTIKARTISDFSGGYDIVDATTGEAVGGAKRKGLKSLFKDEWEVLDPDGTSVGTVEETGGVMIFVRRLFKFLPQTYEVRLGGEVAGTMKQRFNPFQLVYDVDFGGGGLDPRLGVGLVVLLLAIEGGQR